MLEVGDIVYTTSSGYWNENWCDIKVRIKSVTPRGDEVIVVRLSSNESAWAENSEIAFDYDTINTEKSKIPKYTLWR